MAVKNAELWFIFTSREEIWGNLRIATFDRPVNEPDVEIVIIHNETSDRMGVRVWADIVEREGWFKVKQIIPPTMDELIAAMEREDWHSETVR